MSVRPITPEDVFSYRKAVDSVAKERRYLMRLEAPALEAMQRFVVRNLEAGYPHYVAVNGDEVIGWADIAPPHDIALHVGSLGMGVIKEQRGKGLGAELLENVVRDAWAHGFKRLELEVYDDNEPAIHLYEKHGYVLEGRKKYARYIDGVYQDILIMAQYRI